MGANGPENRRHPARDEGSIPLLSARAGPGTGPMSTARSTIEGAHCRPRFERCAMGPHSMESWLNGQGPGLLTREHRKVKQVRPLQPPPHNAHVRKSAKRSSSNLDALVVRLHSRAPFRSIARVAQSVEAAALNPAQPLVRGQPRAPGQRVFAISSETVKSGEAMGRRTALQADRPEFNSLFLHQHQSGCSLEARRQPSKLFHAGSNPVARSTFRNCDRSRSRRRRRLLSLRYMAGVAGQACTHREITAGMHMACSMSARHAFIGSIPITRSIFTAPWRFHGNTAKEQQHVYPETR
jgi:hypothetical protein